MGPGPAALNFRYICGADSSDGGGRWAPSKIDLALLSKNDPGPAYGDDNALPANGLAAGPRRLAGVTVSARMWVNFRAAGAAASGGGNCIRAHVVNFRGGRCGGVKEPESDGIGIVPGLDFKDRAPRRRR